MNIFRGKPIRLLTIIFSMLVSIAMLSACGGSGGGSDTTAGIGGTGIAVGKITDLAAFMSTAIFSIPTSSSQFIVDGDPSARSERSCSIGMVVLCQGSRPKPRMVNYRQGDRGSLRR